MSDVPGHMTWTVRDNRLLSMYSLLIIIMHGLLRSGVQDE
jgi:hypothetical protein